MALKARTVLMITKAQIHSMHKLLKIGGVAALIAMLVAPFVTEKQPVIEPVKPVDPITMVKPDFSSIKPVSLKKETFFDYMRPGIEAENARIIKERQRLVNIKMQFQSSSVDAENKAYAKRIGELYFTTLPANGVTEQWLDEMLLKVNVLPEALVLTQAANESAWGTSRFAKEANNYFGQWCYKKGCGLVPLQRSEGAAHEVAKFSTVSASIYGYFMNVNRNSAYAKLRLIRAKQEANGKDLLDAATATELTNGLLKYSERGQAYVNDLQTMIRINKKYWKTS